MRRNGGKSLAGTGMSDDQAESTAQVDRKADTRRVREDRIGQQPEGSRSLLVFDDQILPLVQLIDPGLTVGSVGLIIALDHIFDQRQRIGPIKGAHRQDGLNQQTALRQSQGGCFFLKPAGCA